MSVIRQDKAGDEDCTFTESDGENHTFIEADEEGHTFKEVDGEDHTFKENSDKILRYMVNISFYDTYNSYTLRFLLLTVR